jgi:glucokinase
LVLAGGLAQAGDILMNPLRKALAEQATGQLWDWEDKLTLTALGDKAGALGAVALALQNIPSPSPPTLGGAA